MLSLPDNNQNDIIEAFSSDSGYLDDFGCLSGPPEFTWWISFAPVFSFIYC